MDNANTIDFYEATMRTVRNSDIQLVLDKRSQRRDIRFLHFYTYLLYKKEALLLSGAVRKMYSVYDSIIGTVNKNKDSVDIIIEQLEAGNADRNPLANEDLILFYMYIVHNKVFSLKRNTKSK